MTLAPDQPSPPPSGVAETAAPACFDMRYDTAIYTFREWACAALGVRDPARTHEELGPCRPNDRSLRARWNTRLLQRLPELQGLLERFIRTELPRVFVDAPEVRHPPMFRIHPPGWDTISPFHHDSDYGLALGAINVWIPLTEVWGGNSLWIESEPGREDYRPVSLGYGQALVFDAVRLSHGSTANDTETTRVSFDFRCHGTLQYGSSK